MLDFTSVIRETERRVVDLTAIDSLFKVEKFVEIYEHPLPYKEAAIDGLRDDTFTQTQKIIAGLSMQRLPEDDFLMFGRVVLDLLIHGRVTPLAFSLMVFPPLNWNSFWVRAYDRPAVRALLVEIASTEAVRANTRRFITDQILTGQARSRLE